MMLLVVIGVAQQLVAQDWAKVRLEKSPRHLEFVKVKLSDQRTVESFIAFPEVKNKAPAVIVIHEIFGLSDWCVGFAINLRKRVTLRSRLTCSLDWSKWWRHA